MNSAPLRTARILSLFLLFSISVVGGSVGLDALIKSNRQKSLFRNTVPGALPGAVVDINTSDIFDTSVVITTICGLLAVFSVIFLLLPLRSPSRGLLRIQGVILAFNALWLLATLIPFDHFFATRGPDIFVSVDGKQVPLELIQAFAQNLGLSTEYRRIHYLRLVAIIPWFAFLLAIISSVLLFITASRIIVPHRAVSALEHEHVVIAKA